MPQGCAKLVSCRFNAEGVKLTAHDGSLLLSEIVLGNPCGNEQLAHPYRPDHVSCAHNLILNSAARAASLGFTDQGSSVAVGPAINRHHIENSRVAR